MVGWGSDLVNTPTQFSGGNGRLKAHLFDRSLDLGCFTAGSALSEAEANLVYTSN